MKTFQVSYWVETGEVVTVHAESAGRAEEYVKRKLELGEDPAYTGHNETVHREYNINETIEVENG